MQATLDLRQALCSAVSATTARCQAPVKSKNLACLSLPHLPTLRLFGRAHHLQRHLKCLQRGSLEVSSLVGRPLSAAEALKQHQGGLSGRWHKDKAQSDSLQEACDMVALPWIYRKALDVLNYLELEDTEEHFKTVLKAGGILDIVECYPWSGETITHSRRDKRRGQHVGRVVRTPDGPSIQVTWENPYGGECSDTFILSDDGMRMTQLTHMRITDMQQERTYRTIFKRVETQ